MAVHVTGEQYYKLDGQLLEIKRQLRQNEGYPHSPEELKEALQAVIEGRFQKKAPTAKEWQLWRPIKRVRKNAKSYESALKKAGCIVDGYSSDILHKPAFSERLDEVEFDLVLATGYDLGFQKNATRKKIFRVALEQGLGKCPAWVGPQLRLDLDAKNQPLGQSCLIAMEPILSSDFTLLVFGISHIKSGLHLDTCYDLPHTKFSLGHVWVFVRLKKPLAV